MDLIKKIVHVNKTIKSEINFMNEKELKSINIRSTYQKEYKNTKKPRVRMIIKERKRLLARLKRKENHLMVMLLCMNAVKTSYIKRMDANEHQEICL